MKNEARKPMSRAMEAVNQAYSDPSVSLWVKTMILSVLGKSVHEAANDASLFASLLRDVAAEHAGDDGALVKDEDTPCAVVLQFPRRKS